MIYDLHSAVLWRDCTSTLRDVTKYTRFNPPHANYSLGSEPAKMTI